MASSITWSWPSRELCEPENDCVDADTGWESVTLVSSSPLVPSAPDSLLKIPASRNTGSLFLSVFHKIKQLEQHPDLSSRARSNRRRNVFRCSFSTSVRSSVAVGRSGHLKICIASQETFETNTFQRTKTRYADGVGMTWPCDAGMQMCSLRCRCRAASSRQINRRPGFLMSRSSGNEMEDMLLTAVIGTIAVRI